MLFLIRGEAKLSITSITRSKWYRRFLHETEARQYPTYFCATLASLVGVILRMMRRYPTVRKDWKSSSQGIPALCGRTTS